jgi:hypothetical protein
MYSDVVLKIQTVPVNYPHCAIDCHTQPALHKSVHASNQMSDAVTGSLKLSKSIIVLNVPHPFQIHDTRIRIQCLEHTITAQFRILFVLLGLAELDLVRTP